MATTYSWPTAAAPGVCDLLGQFKPSACGFCTVQDLLLLGLIPQPREPQVADAQMNTLQEAVTFPMLP
jgi:hypothetical protein